MKKLIECYYVGQISIVYLKKGLKKLDIVSLLTLGYQPELHYWYWYCSMYCSNFASTGTDTELLSQNFATTGTGTALLS
jgi:hypothetical protein